MTRSSSFNHIAIWSLQILFALTMAACRSAPPAVGVNPAAPALPVPIVSSSSKSGSADDGGVSEIVAANRARLIRRVSYNLDLDVRTVEFFKGRLTAKFTLTTVPDRDLAIDFRKGAKVERIELNGRVLPMESYSSSRIDLPTTKLRRGPNELVVAYQRSYGSSGNGLTKFEDPEDQRVYLWTQFEPDFASSVFPCFDQPDLKATWTLRVHAPREWQVISSTRETSVGDEGRTARMWSFPQSPVLSTYLFSFFAGPFAQWTDLQGGTPLRLFARQSMRPFVHADEWFSVTRQGLGFYETYFAYPYPFAKYDQLIIPGFADEGMENVAAATFSEDLVPRGHETSLEREQITTVILHELAHSWFGDLVTMRWWNGLWLNESFASYLATLAMSRTQPSPHAWLDFHDEMKSWAYEEDQFNTAHPVDGAVATSQAAAATFDGITYGKGAALLRQLAFYMGDEKFEQGVRTYIQGHDYQNTRLADFIDALQSTSNRDLVGWARSWLLATGLDRVRADYRCEQGRISQFQIQVASFQQTDSERMHRLKVALSVNEPGVSVEVGVGVTEVKTLIGKKCPDFVYPNMGDLDYVYVDLDPRSRNWALRHWQEIQDPLLKTMLIENLFELVRNAEMPARDFASFAEAALRSERDSHVLQDLLKTLTTGGSTHSAFHFFAREKPTQRETLTTAIRGVERTLWRRLQASVSTSDIHPILLDAFISTAYTNEGRDHLVQLLRRQGALTVDLDRRWNIAIRLSALGDARAAVWVNQLARSDLSERGRELAMAADASRPDPALKMKWIGLLGDEGVELSAARKEAVMRTFLPPWQDDLRANIAESFFRTILDLSGHAEQDEVERYARYLMPAICTPMSAAALQTFVQSHRASLPPVVLKDFQNALQEDHRCITVRARN